MNRIMNVDSPVMRFLSSFADLIVVNLLLILCSLPIITAGAAVTAALRVTRDIMND